jgi:8-oxo-dGTP diphosphatase
MADCGVDYDKVGLLVLRDGKLLLCRKARGTRLLILPGGCREAGESALQCLAREVKEELGDVTVERLQFLGVYTDRAAGEGAKTVRVELYRGELGGEPAPHSEIAELVWFSPAGDRAALAPSIANRILPDLIARGVLDWPAY